MQEHAAQPERPHPARCARGRRTCRRPRPGCPANAEWTRIWCVRPVRIATSMSVATSRKCATALEVGERDLAGAMHAHDTLAALARMGQDRRIDRLAAEPPAAGDAAPRSASRPRPRAAARAPAARPAACARRAGIRWCRDRADARARAIPPGATRAAPRSRRTTAPNRRGPRGLRGLSSTSRRGVFVDDRGPHGLEQPVRNAARCRVRRRRFPHGRQAHFVVRRKPVIRLLALAVDADFAPPQQPVDPAARHARELAQQEIVEPLALRTRRPPAPAARQPADFDPLSRRFSNVLIFRAHLLS